MEEEDSLKTTNPRNLDAAVNLFHACDKDKDGFITRFEHEGTRELDYTKSDLESLLEELQLDESVDTLLTQLGADSSGRISCSQFVKNAQLTAFTSGLPSSGVMEYSDGCMPSGSSDNSLDRNSDPSVWVSTDKSSTKSAVLDSKPPPGRSNNSHQQQNFLQLASTFNVSAVSTLTSEIEDLKRKLDETTREKNKILYERKTKPSSNGMDKRTSDGGEDSLDWELQCQRYEERIVELHSVIAELTRKNEVQRNGVIVEESEAESVVTSNDDGLYEEDEEDYTSLAFERALQDPKTGSSSTESSKFSSEIQLAAPDVDYTAELFALQAQLDEARNDNEKLNELLDEREEKLIITEATMANLTVERDRLRRQLQDIQCTVEFQEAKMDGIVKIPGAPSRSSSERRSLRKKRQEKKLEALNHEKNPSSSKSSNKCSSVEVVNSNSALNSDSPHRRSISDLEMEIEKLSSRVEHLCSQNDVLSLTLEDSKNFTDRLSLLLNKHESNNSALTLSLNYCDHIVESYDVLVALLETEIGILAATAANNDPPSQHQLISGDLGLKRATSNRKSAEKVAKHLLARMLNRSDSGISEGGLPHSQHTWDSSGYSQTASSTSTTSSILNDSEFTKMDELKLRDHISQLKTIRASIQSSVVEVESLYRNEPLTCEDTHRHNLSKKALNLEQAIIQQELMANREERADLKAKVYLLEKEKANLTCDIEERDAREIVLRTHIAHLQEELGEFERDLGLRGVHLMRQRDSREDQLKKRVDTLFLTLDKMTRTTETRQKQSEELIEDLKRANSTLTEALEKNKKKYQSKLKKLEHQLLAASSKTKQ